MRISVVAGRALGQVHDEAGDAVGTDHRPPRRVALRAAVGDEHHIGREQRHHRVDVAAGDGGEQVADELVLARLVPAAATSRARGRACARVRLAS